MSIYCKYKEKSYFIEIKLIKKKPPYPSCLLPTPAGIQARSFSVFVLGLITMTSGCLSIPLRAYRHFNI